MSEPSTAPDADEEILLQFQRDYEVAEDANASKALVEALCTQYPHLAARLRARAEMLGGLAASAAEPEEPLPERLGEYCIVRRIGMGGMGWVYQARHDRLKRRVAVKTIRPDRASPAARDRFRREQLVLARLHQTHIVSILEAGEEGPVHYFAMPFIDGAALSRVVETALHPETAVPHSQTPPLGKLAEQAAARNEQVIKTITAGPADRPPPPMPPPPRSPEARAAKLTLSTKYFRSVAEAMADVAEAVQHIHDAGLVHRDVKPSNLMVDRHGHCWVIDLGLAGILAGADGEAAAGTDPLLSAEPVTATGVLGTPQYMAPEQWRREIGTDKPDPRTDIYGLGVTLYELLTLRRAYNGETHAAIREKILSGEPAPPRALVGNVPADLEAICRKAMKMSPGERYAMAGDLAEDLRRWLRDEPTRARGAGPLRRTWLWARRQPGWAAALCTVGLAILTLILGTISVSRSEAAAAEAEARVAREQMEAANARERQLRRAALLARLERLRLSTHQAGWWDDAWELVRQVSKIHRDDDLRNQAAATLLGIDAATSKSFDFGASQVAFDSRGRLLMVGLSDRKRGKQTGARLWDRATDEVVQLPAGGNGPVAFGNAGAPLQLIGDPKDRGRVQLWDLQRRELLRSFPFPAGGQLAILPDASQPPLAMTSTGARLAALAEFPARQTRAVVVWDAASGKVIREFVKEEARVVTLSPDGSLLAAGDEAGRITVFALPGGEEVAALRVRRMAIHCLAFARTFVRGTALVDKERGPPWLLAAGDAGGTVAIWDLDLKRIKALCQGSNYGIHTVAFSPDGATLASAGRGQARLWDVATGRLLLKVGKKNWYTGVAFAPDGRALAVSNVTAFGPDASVEVWQIDQGRGLRALRGLVAQVAKVIFSPDGRLVAGLSHDWQVGIWDVATGQLRHVLDVPRGLWPDNAGLAFSPDGKQFAFSASHLRTGYATLWDVGNGQELARWTLPPGLQNQLAFHPAGKLLHFQVETKAGKLLPEGGMSWEKQPRICRIRDLRGAKPLEPFAQIEDFNRHVFVTAASADGSHIAAEGIGGGDGNSRMIKVFAGPTGKVVWSRDLKMHAGMASELVMDPGGKLLGFVPDVFDKTVVVELPTGKLLGLREPGVNALAPGERYSARVIADSAHGGCKLYRPAMKRPLVVLGIDTAPSSVLQQFNAAGTMLAWGNEDGTVTLCDINEVQGRLAKIGLGW